MTLLELGPRISRSSDISHWTAAPDLETSLAMVRAAVADGIKIADAGTGRRIGELRDLVADAVGVAVGWLAWTFARRRPGGGPGPSFAAVKRVAAAKLGSRSALRATGTTDSSFPRKWESSVVATKNTGSPASAGMAQRGFRSKTERDSGRGKRGGKVPEIHQPFGTQTKNDLPVDGLVVVNRDVAKAYCFAQALSQRTVQLAGTSEQHKSLPHRVRRFDVRLACQPVRGKVHAELDGPCQVQGNDVLGIEIGGERCRRLRATDFEPRHAATQGLELLVDYRLIHASRRVRRMWFCSGTKSA